MKNNYEQIEEKEKNNEYVFGTPKRKKEYFEQKEIIKLIERFSPK